MQFRRILLPLLVLAAAVASAQAENSAAPAPLRIVVSVPAGGVSDVVARLLGDRLQVSLSRSVVVDNRPGASGRIAVDALMRAAPDGATVLLVPIIVPVVGPLVFKDLNYSPMRDLAPVSQVAKYEFALTVASGSPARDVAGFVAWAKAHPDRATFGTPGTGSLAHFLGVTFGRAAGIDLLHVPYQSAGQLEVDLLGGEIASGITAVSDVLALHREGRIRILATSGSGRAKLLPDVPTFREQGYLAVEANGWHAVFAPAGTPSPLTRSLSNAIVKALETPELRARLFALGLEPAGTTPAQLTSIMAADTARWAKIIEATGFSAPR